ncbi:zinc carboxypeptidase, partial [Ostertagia ostertagi]
AIENEKSPPAFYHPEAGGYSYDKYNSLEDIQDEMIRLRKEKPDMISLIDIGETHENRSLLVIKISGHKSVIGKKISMWIDGGIHAREWIAPATAMYIVRELVNGYDSDPSIQKILDHMDFYILPVMNPDGYEYSRMKAFITLHSYSQMWLIPFGHRKRSYPQDYHTALRPLAEKATKALYDLYGTKYQVGTGADIMYEASGGSHDWAKGSLKVSYAYLIELRPQNSAVGYGFLLPEREIPATGLETFAAIKVVAEEMVATICGTRNQTTGQT